jgi:hypothetical protein
MADYFITFFPRDVATVSTMNSKDQIKSTVTFIADELLENAMKFIHLVVQGSTEIPWYEYEWIGPLDIA